MNFTPARSNEIQCDLDTPEAQARFTRMLKWLVDLQCEQNVYSVSWTIHDSGTTGHKHATVTLLHCLPPMERIVLACILGSDLDREACNYARVKTGAPHPILFLHRRARS